MKSPGFEKCTSGPTSRAIAFFALLALGLPGRTVAAPPEKPNVIFILADDLGSGDLGCFGPLRGHKRDMYEGGIRTPALARWPGRIRPGVTSDQVWAFWDLLPTLAELVGQPAPAGLDGVSILPALLEGKAVDHPPLYWEFHERGFDRAARIGDWKAVKNGAKGPIELYDLKADPGEKHDVASSHPDVVARFREFLDAARVDSAIWPIREEPAAKKAARREANR